MNTIRIFYEAPYQRTFEARILEKRLIDGGRRIVLDKTLFYPTSGGQPCDRGRLNGVDVVDVIEEKGVIIHLVDGDIGQDDLVKGEIDWDRRFDHMQQHTGQHILSQSFLRSAGAETIGFHLGAEYSTIDLKKSEISLEDIKNTEEIANSVVFEDREILTRWIRPEELDRVHLRRTPKVSEEIRVVEIEDFDTTGCCGTHLRRTGEVGLIKVIKSEHYKGGTRIYFLTGRRALGDYQKKMETLRAVCRILTAGEDEVVFAVNKGQQDKLEMSRRLRRLTENLLRVRMDYFIKRAETIGSNKLICEVVDDFDFEDVESLVKKLIREKGIIALFGLVRDGGYLFFGRSKDIEFDMRKILEEPCRLIDGKGGGSPFFVQCRGMRRERIGEAVEAARKILLTQYGD